MTTGQFLDMSAVTPPGTEMSINEDDKMIEDDTAELCLENFTTDNDKKLISSEEDESGVEDRKLRVCTKCKEKVYNMEFHILNHKYQRGLKKTKKKKHKPGDTTA